MSSTHTRAGESIEDRNPDGCPVVEAMEQIGSSWRLIILHNLLGEEVPLNELTRATGATSRTLARVLDDLEDADLIERRVEDKPLATDYVSRIRGGDCSPSSTSSRSGRTSGSTRWFLPPPATRTRDR